MNILFLFCYLPPLESNNGLFVQLINDFIKHGHNVCVSTKGEEGNKTYVHKENGVDVLRIQSHSFTGVSSNVKKALAYQEYAIKQRFYTKKFFNREKFDLIISHSLPPEVAYIVGGLKSFYKCPFYLIQSDYTWQDAVGFGYFSEKSPVARYYQFFEKKMIQLADYIGCPTKGNMKFIRKFYPYVDEVKLDFLPFWQNELEVKPNFQLKVDMGLEGKFVVVYGGSIGVAQRVDHIIELAEICQEYKDMVFVILGKGPLLLSVQQMSKNKNLQNVIFKEFLPQDQYLSFLATCDVGLIILNEKTAVPNFPSKALSYLNMRVPILAALDYVTDFGQFMEENEAGLWAHSDDIHALKQKLMDYYHSTNLVENVKEKGYLLFKSQLTTEHAYNVIMNRFKECNRL